jgi:plastocyanin
VRAGRTAPLALAAAAALLCAAPAGAGAPQRKTVQVLDNYYLPAKLTVNRDSTIAWKWSAEQTLDVHDVKLKKAPRGAKKFHSQPAAGGFTFKRKLSVAGKYEIVCTLHEEMSMTITVRKRR